MYKRSQNRQHIAVPNADTRIYQTPVFNIPKSDTKTLGRSILVKGGLEWNNLEVNLRNSETHIIPLGRRRKNGWTL